MIQPTFTTVNFEEGNKVHFERFELLIDEIYSRVPHISLLENMWETLREHTTFQKSMSE